MADSTVNIQFKLKVFRSRLPCVYTVYICSIVTLDKVMCEHIWSIYSEYGTQKMRLHSQRASLKIYFIWSNTRWFSLNLFKLFLRGQFWKLRLHQIFWWNNQVFLNLWQKVSLNNLLVLLFDRNCSEPQLSFWQNM